MKSTARLVAVAGQDTMWREKLSSRFVLAIRVTDCIHASKGAVGIGRGGACVSILPYVLLLASEGSHTRDVE